jgi:glutaredoxin 3
MLPPLAPGARSEKSGGVSADVTIYTTDYCPYCTRAKALLTKKQAQFKEVKVDTRDDLRSWLASASGQRTVPQIFINGESVGGFTELADLDRKGELDRRLRESPGAGAPALPA